MIYKPEPQPIDPALLEPQEPQVMGNFAWLLGGLILPCAAPDFYRFGVRRKIGQVLLFFDRPFNVLLSLLMTAKMGYVMADARTKINEAFASGQFPEITINHGYATVHAPQPFVIMDSATQLMVIDTTGYTTGIDTRRYTSGIVLTRDRILTLNNGRLQAIPLNQLQQVFKVDPLVIDANMVTGLWNQVTLWLVLGTLLFELLWTVLVRIAWLLAIAWIIRAIASIFRKGVQFSDVFITGIYALVPAYYVGYLLQRVHVNFFLLQTVILVVIWSIALIPALRRRPAHGQVEETNLAGWQAWVGVPMLLLLAWDCVVALPDAVILVWIVAVVTLLLYVTMVMFLGSRPAEESQAIS